MASVLHFTKMHGLGNDFVVADGRNAAFDIVDHAEIVADRRFGVGCDQLIIAREATDPSCDIRMEIVNADGSVVEMCGNGIRCLALWLQSHGGYRKSQFRVETLAGVIIPTILPDGQVEVDMGPATFVAGKLPASSDHFAADQELVDATLAVEDQTYEFCGVQVGNPHFVTLVDDLDSVQLQAQGEVIENHPAFPNRINVEFVAVRGNEAHVLVWERGSGATLACGTGATAVGAALLKTGRCSGEVTVNLPGGALRIAQRDGHMFMTGPAIEVYSGTLNEDGLLAAAGVRNV